MFKHFTGLIAVCAALTSSAAIGQQDFSSVAIVTEKLSETTYMMVGAGGNLGVSIGDDAVFLIDAQFAPMTPKIEAAIAKLTAKPVRFLLNTHWHGDHTGGNENVGRSGTLIIAHENTRKRLGSEQFIEFLHSTTRPAPQIALPVVTFSSDMTFHINGDDMFVFHVPRAHTDGDAVVYFRKSNVLHMGDTFFNTFYPFIDASSGGSIDGVVAAADRALEIADDKTKIIPGHGPLATKADLRRYRDMLATVSASIKTMIRDGRKLEEIVVAKPTANFDAAWGKGFIPPDKFVEMVAKILLK